MTEKPNASGVAWKSDALLISTGRAAPHIPAAARLPPCRANQIIFHCVLPRGQHIGYYTYIVCI